MVQEICLRDKKGNLVNVCLFESYLARHVLSQTSNYQELCLKILTQIENFFKPGENENYPYLKEIASDDPRLSLDRRVFSLFTTLSQKYPGYDSLDSIKNNFSLSVFLYFLKLMADRLLKRQYSDPDLGFFKRSPYSPERPVELFSEKNRGVTVLGLDEEVSSQALGIMDDEYCPEDLQFFYETPGCPAKYYYMPDEQSSVATWLRERCLPIISGASGSTELLFARILPLLRLPLKEQEILFFIQAMDMVAQGHHSFFESALVAEHFHLKRSASVPIALIDFYLDWVPDTLKSQPSFHAFMSEKGSLLASYMINLPQPANIEEQALMEGSFYSDSTKTVNNL